MPTLQGKFGTMNASSAEIAAQMAAAMVKFQRNSYGVKPVLAASSKQSTKNSSEPGKPSHKFSKSMQG